MSSNADVKYLLSLGSIRDRAKKVWAAAQAGQLTHFDLHEDKLDDVANFVISVIERDFGPDKFHTIPPHGRWQHFEVGAVPRVADLLQSWKDAGCTDATELTRRLVDLFFVSVLLDAGAGDVWQYVEPGTGGRYERSEGIAVASLYMFKELAFTSSKEPSVDGKGLEGLTAESLAKGFQVSDANQMLGVDSRAGLLRSLGTSLLAHPDVFGANGRPGNLVDYMLKSANDSAELDILTLWDVLQNVLIPSWPKDRTTVAGVPIGDAWPLSTLQRAADSPSETAGIQPFHKLTQWLTYSLTVPFQRLLNKTWINAGSLTGLPEYRNGGLFVDLGALTLKPEALEKGVKASGGKLPLFDAGDDVIVEWRSMTLSLLDVVYEKVVQKMEAAGKGRLNMAQAAVRPTRVCRRQAPELSATTPLQKLIFSPAPSALPTAASTTMAPPQLKTSFVPTKVIQSFYTGGKCALSADGRILASTLDEDVILTHLQTGQELARIEGDSELISTLALTPNASHLITCSRSFTMRIYALTISSPLASISFSLSRAVKAHDAPVITAAVDPTGTLLATGGSDGLVKVWDIKGGFVTHNLRGHGGVISALSFFAPPDKNARKWRLASAADDTKVIVWDLYTRKLVKVLEGHNSVVRGLDWSVDGSVLVSGGRDAVFIIWETGKWEARGQVPVMETLETVGFLKDGSDVGQGDGEGQVVYTAGDKGSIRLWSSRTGKAIPMAKGEQEDEIVDVIYSSDANTLISVHNDQTFLVRAVAPNLPITSRISGHLDEIIDLQYLTPTDSLLALASNSEDIRIISPSEGSFGDVGVLKGHSDIAICLDKDATGNWLASGGKDNEARLWRIDPAAEAEKERFTCYARFVGHTESIGAVALSRGPPADTSERFPTPPKFLITGSKDSTIKRWEVPKLPATQDKKVVIKSSKATFTRKAHDKDINFIDVSADDRLFATASQDRTIKVWSTETGETLGICRGHRRGVWSVRFGPSHITASSVGGEGAGRLLLSASGDKTVRLWNLADYTCVKTLEGHAGIVLKAMWLNEGLQVVSAGGEGLVKVWEARTGECVSTLDGHEDKVWALAGQRDESVVVTGGGDSVVTFWKDVSERTREEKVRKAEKAVEQEQKLSNLIQAKDYRSAIVLALELNYPYKLLKLLTAVIDSPTPESDSITGLKSVDAVLAGLNDHHLYLLLCRLRDWNTNSRTAGVAQRVLAVLMRSFPAEKFVSLKVPGARKGGDGDGEGAETVSKRRKGERMAVPEIMEIVERYTERHYARVEELLAESYIVEYTLNQMEEAAFVDGKAPARVLKDVNGMDEEEEEVEDGDSEDQNEEQGSQADEDSERSDESEDEGNEEDEDSDVEMQ
ncbi:Beta-TrCP [Drechslerella dactyloides]|uniref:Beta-TrCP n=1 Tax=Drechslerella dactyloides TaxID=74499 RepID=A0AAD6J4J2_DREDA|nr:Beta-TrCP [Drechslerella dactyloides]